MLYLDAAGNMTTMPQPLDPTDDYTATYDAWNRLVEIADGMTTVVTNEYDGLNQRIVKDVSGGDTFDYYYNQNWQVIAEEKSSFGSTPDAMYAWHPYYIDALAVRFRADDKIVFLHDANFNVVAAYDVNPSSGTYRQVVERYQYTPYGEVTFLNADFTTKGASSIDNRYLFTGRERDSSSKLQINRNRWYHAGLGRWPTRDPIGYLGGMNLYGYVGDTPLVAVDPQGFDGVSVTRNPYDRPPGHGRPSNPYDRPGHGASGGYGSYGSYRNKACCNGTEYDPKTQCCQDGNIVEKVSIWICKRPLDIPPWTIGVVDFWQLDWLMPGEDADVSHSYVCCDGPNMNCFGMQKKQPDPDGDGPLEPPWTRKGDPIQPEMLKTGNCLERRVCPKVKDMKCNNPISDRDYSIRKGDACHGWAWECVPYWSWE